VSDFADRLASLPDNKIRLLALKLKQRLDAAEGDRHAPIAVVGVGCRFPGGVRSPADFWRLLDEGRDAITEVPADRWEVDAWYDPNPDAPGKMATRWGGFVDGIDRFDAGFFGVSPREAFGMDPQQRMLLEVSWEALEDGAQNPDKLSCTRAAVFTGLSTHDHARALTAGALDHLGAYAGTGAAPSVAAGRLSYLLGLQGPSMVVDTACSSSLVATHLAVQSLRTRECDVALAGGVSLVLSPEGTVFFSKLRAMAADGRCKAFDARADGYVRSDGCGVLVLKRLSDAVAAGDPIRAVIRGTAINHDGPSSGLTVPNGPSQQAVIRDVFASAQLSPAAISYVEAHGTGTPLGDPIEIGALSGVFGAHPVAVGSVKTNIGHAEAAAGVAGMIKTILALQKERLPRHLHVEEPNPRIRWDDAAIELTAEARPWTGEDRVAGVSSFGFSGTNAHVLLAAAPAPERPAEGLPAGPHLVVLSARSEAALAQATRSLARADIESVASVAHTLGVRRAMHGHRRAVVANTGDDLRAALAASPPAIFAPRTRAPVFVFGGQGSQWLGMGRGLLERDGAFTEAIAAIERAFASEVDWSLTAQLSARADHPGESRLDDDAVAQPMLFAVQSAIAAAWRARGFEPAAVIGHSQGEVAAAYVSGALSLEDAAAIICRRSQKLDRVRGGGMMMVERAADALRSELPDGVTIAAINGPENTILSGDAGALDTLQASFDAREIFARRIKVEYASHSAHVEPLEAVLGSELAALRPRPTDIPMMSTVEARYIDGDALTADYWYRNLRQTVRFADAVQRLITDGLDLFVEMSPHPILRPAIESCGGDAAWSLERDGDDPTVLLGSMGRAVALGAIVDERALFGDAPVVQLPPYPWQGETIPRVRSSDRPASHGLARVDGPIDQFEAVMHGDGWLEEHQLFGARLVPGAGHVAVLQEAATVLLGDVVDLRDVSFLRPLIIAPDASRRLRVVRGADDRLSLYADGDGWLEHAEAIATSGEAIEVSSHRPEGLEPLDPATYFTALETRGYRLGPRFRQIDALWVGDGEAWAEMAPFDGDRDGQPGFIDSCFQVLGAAARARTEGAFVPAHVDRVRFTGALKGTLAVHAQVETVDADGVTGSLTLFDGAVAVARFDGFAARRVDQGDLIARMPVAQLCHGIEWVEVDAVPTSTGPNATAPTTGANTNAAARTGSPPWIDGPLWTNDSALAAYLAAAADRSIELVDAPERAAHAVFRNPSCGDVLPLLQAILRSDASPQIWFFTSGAQPEGADIEQAAVWGLARTLAHEHPALTVRLVDAIELDDVVAELAIRDDETQIVRRGAVRSAARLVRRSMPSTPPARGASSLRADRTYLVTGGTGDLGRAVIAWLRENGAEHVLALARTPADVPDAQVEAVDVTDEALVQQVIARADPPLAGVIHTAGVLDDALLEQLDLRRLDNALQPKLRGAWNLHRATEGLELDFFVLFSSIAGVLGSPGQANYAAGNAACDGLAAHRNQLGLPGTSSGWGAWTEIGAAARQDERGARLAAQGVAGLPPAAGLAALEALLDADGSWAVMPFDFDAWAKHYPAAARAPLFEAFDRPQPRVDLRPALEAADPRARARILESFLREQVGAVLHMAPAAIHRDVALGDLGLDSLMALELRNRVEAGLGLRLSATLVWNYPTLRDLVPYLAERLDVTLDDLETPAVETESVAQEKIETLEEMSDAEAEAQLAARLAAFEERRR